MPKGANAPVATVKNLAHETLIVDWSPTGFMCGINFQPLTVVPRRRPGQSDANHVHDHQCNCHRWVFSRIDIKFDLMHSQRAVVPSRTLFSGGAESMDWWRRARSKGWGVDTTHLAHFHLVTPLNTLLSPETSCVWFQVKQSFLTVSGARLAMELVEQLPRKQQHQQQQQQPSGTAARSAQQTAQTRRKKMKESTLLQTMDQQQRQLGVEEKRGRGKGKRKGKAGENGSKKGAGQGRCRRCGRVRRGAAVRTWSVRGVARVRQLSLCGSCGSAAGNVQSYNKMLFYPFHNFDWYWPSGGKAGHQKEEK